MIELSLEKVVGDALMCISRLDGNKHAYHWGGEEGDILVRLLLEATSTAISTSIAAHREEKGGRPGAHPACSTTELRTSSDVGESEEEDAVTELWAQAFIIPGSGMGRAVEQVISARYVETHHAINTTMDNLTIPLLQLFLRIRPNIWLELRQILLQQAHHVSIS